MRIDPDEEREALEDQAAQLSEEERREYEASEAESNTLWGVGMSHW